MNLRIAQPNRQDYTRSFSKTRAKVATVIGLILLGFIVLLIGVGLVNAGLTAQSCSGGIFGFFATCHPTIDYSLLAFGTIFLGFSAPIFYLGWKAYTRPEMTSRETTTVRETIVKEVILTQCRSCGARYPQGTTKCFTCGANLI